MSDDNPYDPASPEEMQAIEDLNRRLEERWRPINESKRRIYASRGYRVLEWLGYLERTRGVFETNVEELMRWIAQLSFPEFVHPLMSIDHPERVRTFQQETMRLLHNMVASVATLVDHSRHLRAGLYSEHEFGEEYQEHVRVTFQESPLACFVRELRNLVLHKGFPTTTLVTTFQTGTARLELPTAALKVVWTWTSQAIRFLDEEGEFVRLAFAVDRYRKLVRDFHLWFKRRQLELHASDLEELRELERAHGLVVKPASAPRQGEDSR